MDTTLIKVTLQDYKDFFGSPSTPYLSMKIVLNKG